MLQSVTWKMTECGSPSPGETIIHCLRGFLKSSTSQRNGAAATSLPNFTFHRFHPLYPLPWNWNLSPCRHWGAWHSGLL